MADNTMVSVVRDDNTLDRFIKLVFEMNILFNLMSGNAGLNFPQGTPESFHDLRNGDRPYTSCWGILRNKFRILLSIFNN
jgi:hypothetical protein